VIDDSLFAIGALVLGWFVLGLMTGHSYDKNALVKEGKWAAEPVPARQMGD
jgi:nitric oxide reductase subunit B